MALTDWLWERCEKTCWINEETGAKMYFGHFVRFLEEGEYETAEVRFWAHHPFLAMRLMAASGDPTTFADQLVN